MDNEKEAKNSPQLTAAMIIKNLEKELETLNQKKTASLRAIDLNTRKSKATLAQYEVMIEKPQLCEPESEYQKDPKYWEAVKEMLRIKKEDELWNLEMFTKQNQVLIDTLNKEIVDMNEQIKKQKEKLDTKEV